jgi:hypothetical protein
MPQEKPAGILLATLTHKKFVSLFITHLRMRCQPKVVEEIPIVGKNFSHFLKIEKRFSLDSSRRRRGSGTFARHRLSASCPYASGMLLCYVFVVLRKAEKGHEVNAVEIRHRHNCIHVCGRNNPG